MDPGRGLLWGQGIVVPSARAPVNVSLSTRGKGFLEHTGDQGASDVICRLCDAGGQRGWSPSPWIPTWKGCHLPEEQARCCRLHRGGLCPHWAPARKEPEHHGRASRGSAETPLLMTLPEPEGPAGMEPESPKTFVTRLHPRLGCSAGRSPQQPTRLHPIPAGRPRAGDAPGVNPALRSTCVLTWKWGWSTTWT